MAVKHDREKHPNEATANRRNKKRRAASRNPICGDFESKSAARTAVKHLPFQARVVERGGSGRFGYVRT